MNALLARVQSLLAAPAIKAAISERVCLLLDTVPWRVPPDGGPIERYTAQDLLVAHLTRRMPEHFSAGREWAEALFALLPAYLLSQSALPSPTE